MDEISYEKLEKEHSAQWVEDSVGQEEEISIQDMIMKWTDIVEEVLRIQTTIPKDIIITDEQDAKSWNSFKQNFHVYSSRDENIYVEKIFPRAYHELMENDIKNLGKDKMVRYEITMDLRVFYDPLDSGKIKNHLKGGPVQPNRISFNSDDKESTKMYSATRRVNAIQRMTNRTHDIIPSDIVKAREIWDTTWSNQEKVKNLIQTPTELMDPGFFEVNSDWVSTFVYTKDLN